MKYLFALLLSALGACCYSQDVMTLKTGDEQTVKVLEVGIAEIKYRKFDNPDGPVYSVPRSDVFMIKYKNGDKDVFSNTPSKTTSANKEHKDFMTAFEIKSKGYCGILEIGTTILVSSSSNDGSFYSADFPMFSFLFFNGARISKNFSLGFETGVSVAKPAGFGYPSTSSVIIPATIALRVNILNKRITPFIEFNTGFNYINSPAYFFNDYGSNTLIGGTASLSVGAKVWVVKQVAVSMRVGYTGYYDSDSQSTWHMYNAVPVMFGAEF